MWKQTNTGQFKKSDWSVTTFHKVCMVKRAGLHKNAQSGSSQCIPEQKQVSVSYPVWLSQIDVAFFDPQNNEVMFNTEPPPGTQTGESGRHTLDWVLITGQSQSSGYWCNHQQLQKIEWIPSDEADYKGAICKFGFCFRVNVSINSCVFTGPDELWI